METFVLTVHYIICITMVILVLLQIGKGASIGATFGGGGSQTLFGPRGAATFFTKATTVAAIAFLMTSVWLAHFSKEKSVGSVLDKLPVDAVQEEVVTPQEPIPESK
jgi:preprotein translocase subunit SecG